MNTEPDRLSTGISTGEEGSAEIHEAWMPFLEKYEQVLRRGEARTPEQWLSDHPQLPKELHANLEQLYWLYGSGERTLALPAVLESPLPTIPGYVVLEVLGRGGMGIVYKARQKSLDRVVALKMLREGALADDESRRRFRREAEAAARLRHPHIVQVFEIDEQDRRAYFALEYVEGGSLAAKIRGTPQPPGEAARLVETLARTMSYAHQQGIVHRDLKPSNILLQISDLRFEIADLKSEILNLPSAIPKIADFGLAKQVDAAAASAGPQTQSGAIVGTAEYMSPEQAAGQTKVIGPPADIYSLGAILYELLTGRPPFKGTTLVDTVQQVIHDEPVSPRRLQPKVPRDLETICLKCLHKEPNRRYATALDLAEDLRRFQDGKPIQARATGTWERGVKWAKRRPAAGALVAVSTLSVLILGIVLVRSNKALREAAVEANQQRARAEEYFRDAAKIAIDASKVLGDMGKHQEALGFANRVIELLESGMRQESLTDSQRTVALPQAYFIRAGHLVELGRHEEAVAEFDRALEAKLRPASDLACRRLRAVSLARIGDHRRSAAAAETLAANPATDPGDLCVLACAYSLSVDAVRRDAKLPAAERDALAEQYADQALALLAKANAAGFFKDPANLEELKKVKDLDSLRPLDKFKKLLKEIEKQQKS
jgi:serine/threonine protein kinase